MRKILLHVFSTFLFACLFSFFLPIHVFAFSGYGNGTSSDPYQIQNCSQLEEIKNNLSAYYQQDNDIDCSGVSLAPIGVSSNEFSGTFDGKNFAITNFNMTTSLDAGLFGYTHNATVKISDW